LLVDLRRVAGGFAQGYWWICEGLLVNLRNST